MLPPRPTRNLRLTRAGEWYDARLPVHSRLAEKVRTVLEELLRVRGIQFHRVDARVKTRQSFLDKAAKRTKGRVKYNWPSHEIKDVVGVRVVTYLESAVDDVGAVIDTEFDVDPKNSLDKSELLGTDRFGYRSKHYVATMGARRGSLPECAEFQGVSFEIQVRSLLQHAWAELEHDRRFKFKGQLPAEVRRRFSLVAAQLEAADREFNEIAREIDDRAATTARLASSSQSTSRLTLVNATEYMMGILAEHLRAGRVEPGLAGEGGRQLLEELTNFGVSTLGDLANLFPGDFTIRYPESLEDQTTFVGVLRDAMILRDAKRYFEKSYRRERWDALTPSDIHMCKKYGVDIEPLRRKYGISVDGPDDEDDEVN